MLGGSAEFMKFQRHISRRVFLRETARVSLGFSAFSAGLLGSTRPFYGSTGIIDARLLELGIVLDNPVMSVGSYLPWVKTGNLVFISGQGAVGRNRIEYRGKVGDTLSLEDAIASARLTAINILAHLRNACDGDLDRVKQFVKLLGFVNCVPNFTRLPQVLDGASDLFIEVFGAKGQHARFVAGVNSLPFDLSVTCEAVVEIEPASAG
jgi:enamine deaminase RidA (YjgF/YER057c/UK114 family)